MKTTTLIIEHSRLLAAKQIEDVLCLATLIACEVLPHEATLFDANEYYKQLDTCGECPFHTKCLADIINE